MGRSPARIISPDGLDQTVVRQLKPGCSASFLSANQMRIFKLRKDLVIQSITCVATPQRLAAHSLRGDQLFVEPRADAVFTHASRARRALDLVCIIVRQRCFDLTYLRDVLGCNLAHIRRQLVPQSSTHQRPRMKASVLAQ